MMKDIANKVNPADLKLDFVTDQLLAKTFESRSGDFSKKMKEVFGDELYDQFDEFSTKDATVWIDPLDGTAGFVKGYYYAVTCLIDLEIAGAPKIGVMHITYTTNDTDSPGMTLFGTAEHGTFQLDFDHQLEPAALLKREPEYLEPFDLDKELEEEQELRVATTFYSPSRSEAWDQTLNLMKPCKTQRFGGAGCKVSQVIFNNMDCYLDRNGGLCYWDLDFIR